MKDDAPINASKSRSKKRPGPPASNISVWTRFGIKVCTRRKMQLIPGVQNGAPVFMRRERTSSSTYRECVTAYYESFSRDELRSPPDLPSDSQLEEGDIYINIVYGPGTAQMWIWTRDGGRVAFWKVAKEGDVREAGRRCPSPRLLGCLRG